MVEECLQTPKLKSTYVSLWDESKFVCVSFSSDTDYAECHLSIQSSSLYTFSLREPYISIHCFEKPSTNLFEENQNSELSSAVELMILELDSVCFLSLVYAIRKMIFEEMRSKSDSFEFLYCVIF